MAKGKKTGGRVAGVPNKITADIKEAARKHGATALQTIVDLMGSEDERVKLSAAQTILDRAYGKAAQSLTGEGGEGPVAVIFKTVYEQRGN